MWAYFPKLTTTKTVVISDVSLNVMWYLFHLPLIGYAVYVFAVARQHTIVIGNAPFILLDVDTLANEPYLNAPIAIPDPATEQWCASTGGPFPCLNSTQQIFEECVSVLNLDVVSQVYLQLNKACTRGCVLPVNLECVIPAATVSQTGSSVLEVLSLNAFNTGNLMSGALEPDIWILLNHLVRVVPITLTYSFQLAETPPYFFGQVEGVAERKRNVDAHTVAVSKTNEVMYSFSPGTHIVMTLEDFVQMAGAAIDLTMLMNGAEFSIMANCYNNAMDLPPLIWTSDPVVPDTRTPLCLVTADMLRNSSLVKISDYAGNAIRASIRIEAQRGNSFFRLPSLAELVLSLISIIVLLSLPTTMTTALAGSSFGSLSKIFKKAQVDTWNINVRVPSLALRLVSDSRTLHSLGKDGADIVTALHGMLELLHPKLAHTAEDVVGHIFTKPTPETPGTTETKTPTMACLSDTYQAAEVCAYFDRGRRWERTLAPSLKVPSKPQSKSREPSQSSQSQKDEKDVANQASRMASRLARRTEMEKGPVPCASDLQEQMRKARQSLEDLASLKDEEEEDTNWANVVREKLERLVGQLEGMKQRVHERKAKAAAKADAHEKALQAALMRKTSLELRFMQAETQRAKIISAVAAFRERVDESGWATRLSEPLPTPRYALEL